MSWSQIVTPRVVVQVLLFIVLLPFLPLLISGRWGWWEAWLYGLTYMGGFAVSRLLAARRHPELVVERAQTLQREDAAPWDRRLFPLLMLASISIVVVAGLDERFGWSGGFPVVLRGLALCLILGGYALSTWALVENPFFSGVARIQAERGQYVVSSGPYRWVRHPGYAGGLMTYLATPLFFDSAWAFLPTVFVILGTLVRTELEDRMLQEGLVGYREYTQRVRYRILPGVW